MSDRTTRTYLASHPRMIGVLFFVLLLLVQTGPALAVGAVSNHGP